MSTFVWLSSVDGDESLCVRGVLSQIGVWWPAEGTSEIDVSQLFS